MKRLIYSVYDTCGECYQPPFLMKTKGEGIRAFTQAVNDSSTPLFKYPADYVLFELGTFDDVHCKYDLYKAPLRIGTAIEFKHVEPEEDDRQLQAFPRSVNEDS